MNFIFKSKQRTPAELVKHLRDTIARLDNGSSSNANNNSSSNGNDAALASSSAGGPSHSNGANGGAATQGSGGGGSSDSRRKASEDISKTLFQMKAILYGDGENNEPQPEMVAQLAQEVYNHNMLQLLVQNIWRFEFEAKKDVSQIFNNLLRRQIGSRLPTVEYLSQKPEIIFIALRGYENADVALNTGIILREMLRHEPLAKILLHSDK
ncbi:ARM repeat-containing protein [Tilletiaria anomala UBC 951]|uniref:ARM repeat-containing protein n=1 Tax=Tilletiaria anomala (strain ATCC 24038 / CBS 436.72 / UBC 951) TaxID=1037660 RepID=A0A066VGW8_TILAU|nr:ARM repeat-containing protein [Tilletiaria anomala UBC 951]KDN39548.1 ARM repeat-containing protein [Tilletiaria anomala UBC 951]